MTNYILVGREPVECDDILEWAKWYETGQRILDQTWITSKVMVSTVFLGIDHSFSLGGPPILFETMVFRYREPDKKYGLVMNCDTLDQYSNRYQTYEQAKTFHQITVSLVQKSLRHRLKKRKRQTARCEGKKL